MNIQWLRGVYAFLRTLAAVLVCGIGLLLMPGSALIQLKSLEVINNGAEMLLVRTVTADGTNVLGIHGRSFSEVEVVSDPMRAPVCTTTMTEVFFEVRGSNVVRFPMRCPNPLTSGSYIVTLRVFPEIGFVRLNPAAISATFTVVNDDNRGMGR